MSERDVELAAHAKKYAALVDQRDDLQRKRREVEMAQERLDRETRELEKELFKYVGENVKRRAVHLGCRTVVIEWQSPTSKAAIHLIETVTP